LRTLHGIIRSLSGSSNRTWLLTLK
jgi:hypothetical protein